MRELDSKLLLAVIAAERGHQVVLSDLVSLMWGIDTVVLQSGIFHTKSLSPSNQKISRHQRLVDKGFSITSIDEEGGLLEHGYERFAAVRYGERTMQQASAIFGWGLEDTDTLKKVYPSHESKIHSTGSPRADQWKSQFSSYWGTPKAIPNKPYLLVSSTMASANNMRRFHETVRSERDAGYFQRDPSSFSRLFGVISEDFLLTLAFIEAIRHLATANDDYAIVFRPHPVENIDAWKVYLEGIPNVHVIREGSITAWINSAFAVMHNGCTTALEATISGKPVVTFLPFKQKYGREIPNKLGVAVETAEELEVAVARFFRTSQLVMQKSDSVGSALPVSIAKKIYLDEEELAAQKIVKVWEKLRNSELSRPNNWTRFRALLWIVKLRGVLRPLFQPTKLSPGEGNYKFPPVDRADILDRVRRLQLVLGLDEELECKILSERTVLIRRKAN